MIKSIINFFSKPQVEFPQTLSSVIKSFDEDSKGKLYTYITNSSHTGIWSLLYKIKEFITGFFSGPNEETQAKAVFGIYIIKAIAVDFDRAAKVEKEMNNIINDFFKDSIQYCIAFNKLDIAGRTQVNSQAERSSVEIFKQTLKESSLPKTNEIATNTVSNPREIFRAKLLSRRLKELSDTLDTIKRIFTNITTSLDPLSVDKQIIADDIHLREDYHTNIEMSGRNLLSGQQNSDQPQKT